MDSIITLIIISLMGWSISRWMQMRGHNALLWFAIGALLSFIGLFVLYALPFGLFLLLLGATLFYTLYLQKEAPSSLPPDQQIIDIKGERLPPPIDWYYLDDKQQQQGPFSSEELQQLFNERSLTLDTLVWNENLGEWKKMRDLT